MIIIFLLSYLMQESRPLLSLAMTSEVRVSDSDGTHEGGSYHTRRGFWCQPLTDPRNGFNVYSCSIKVTIKPLHAL